MTLIRHATADDLDQLVAMAQQFHGESPRYAAVPFCAADMLGFLSNALERTETSCIFVAESGDSVGAGHLRGMIGGMLSVYMFNHRILKYSDFGLYVRPEYRGSGVFLRLLRAYESWGIQAGVAPEDIMLGESAGINSPKLHDILLRLGYTVDGTSYRKSAGQGGS